MRHLLSIGLLLTGLSGGSALAADMPVKAPPIVPVIDLWTGFYVGLNGGYSWGHARTTLTETEQVIGTITRTTLGGTVLDTTTIVGPLTSTVLGDRTKMNGWLGGGQAGYNRKFGDWLIGIEADLQATGQEGGNRYCVLAGCPVGTTFATADFSLNWFGTLRGRAGWVWDNRLLLYATGGLAVGEVESDLTLGFVGTVLPLGLANATHRRAGWVAGGGGEYRFSERWSAKLEYLYMDLGSVDSALNASVTSLPLILTVGDFRFVGVATTNLAAQFHTRFTDNILRAGVNYRF